MGTYSEPAKLTDGIKLEYPDFTLEYLGTEKKDNKPGYMPPVYLQYNFLITDSSGQEQTFGWHTMGLIAPRRFEVNGKTFFLVVTNNEVTVKEGRKN